MYFFNLRQLYNSTTLQRHTIPGQDSLLARRFNCATFHGHCARSQLCSSRQANLSAYDHEAMALELACGLLIVHLLPGLHCTRIESRLAPAP